MSREPSGAPTGELPTPADVERAAALIAGKVLRTPVVRCPHLDEATGVEVYLKCENLQVGGAFKARGAMNAVWSLTDAQAARGVAAHSSGNHAAALALAARDRGIPAWLVVPRTAPEAKVAAVEEYGGRIERCEPTMADRQATLERVLARTGATEIHPYDDSRVIAGAGTAVLELVDEVGPLDLVVAPVSGGGLISGTAVALEGCSPETRIWGVEPSLHDDAARSLALGEIAPAGPGGSIADGLAAVLSRRTFTLLRRHVERVVVVEESEIISAMRFAFERCKLVTEPSSAVALAALLREAPVLPARVGVIVSGGNVDLDRLPFSLPGSRASGR